MVIEVAMVSPKKSYPSLVFRAQLPKFRAFSKEQPPQVQYQDAVNRKIMELIRHLPTAMPKSSLFPVSLLIHQEKVYMNFFLKSVLISADLKPGILKYAGTCGGRTNVKTVRFSEELVQIRIIEPRTTKKNFKSYKLHNLKFRRHRSLSDRSAA